MGFLLNQTQAEFNFNHNLYNCSVAMLPYSLFYPQNMILGSYDYLAQNMISFPFGNGLFIDSPVVLLQTPTTPKSNQLLNPVNTSPNDKSKVNILDQHCDIEAMFYFQYVDIQNSVQKQNRFGRKISKNHQKKKIRSHSHQNEIRNIFSNIARLIINFVALESKSKTYLLQMLKINNPNIKQFQICQFYKEAVISKKKIKTVYLSKNTFYEFLGLRINQTNSMLALEQFQTKDEFQVKKTFRSLAYYYLHSILSKQIIHSKKINPNLKQAHLKIGADLLQTLRLMETV